MTDQEAALVKGFLMGLWMRLGFSIEQLKETHPEIWQVLNRQTEAKDEGSVEG